MTLLGEMGSLIAPNSEGIEGAEGGAELLEVENC